jgi:hypothetical protein
MTTHPAGAFCPSSRNKHSLVKLLIAIPSQSPLPPLWPDEQQNSLRNGAQSGVMSVSEKPWGHCVPAPMLCHPSGKAHLTHSSPLLKSEHSLVALFTIVSPGAGAANTVPIKKMDTRITALI